MSELTGFTSITRKASLSYQNYAILSLDQEERRERHDRYDRKRIADLGRGCRQAQTVHKDSQEVYRFRSDRGNLSRQSLQSEARGIGSLPCQEYETRSRAEINKASLCWHGTTKQSSSIRLPLTDCDPR